MNRKGLSLRVCCKCALVVLMHQAGAQDHPTTGIVQNQLENSAITYECALSAQGRLDCSFTQMSVRRKANGSDLEGALRASRAEAGKRPDAETCKMATQLRDVMTGKAATPKPEQIAKLTAIQKRDFVQSATAMLAICSDPSEANYTAMTRLQHEMSARTCVVSSHSFKQSFAPLSANSGKTWNVISAPSGDCGTVQLDRFERDESKGASGKFAFWNYFAKKAITNPRGKSLGLIACSGLDEREYPYLWTSDQRQLSCDYIEFSP